VSLVYQAGIPQPGESALIRRAMSVKISCVITNRGDGSNGLLWVTDPAVVALMQQKADEGNECYASGDGLQVWELVFPDGFDLGVWLISNNISLMTLEDIIGL
jgi:hypothetical protein